MPVMNPTGAMTFRDIAASLDEKSPARAVIDLMRVRSDIWEDIVNVSANQGRSHKVFYRTGLPKASFVRLYGGVESSKGAEAEATITLAAIESKMEMDKRLLEWYPDAGQRIAREAASHIDALTLGYVKEMLYGSKKLNPDSFNGLATIYNDAGGTNPNEIAFNVISAGGATSASLGSIFLVGHGTEGFVNLHPQGHASAGVDVSEMYEETIHEANAPTKTYRGKIQTFTLSGAPFVTDWRKCGRLCNIARNQTFADNDARKAAALEFFTKLGQLTIRVDDKGVRQSLYMDKGVLEQIKIFSDAITRTNAIKEEDVNGHKVTTINGIPVRINDAQYVDEPVVS